MHDAAPMREGERARHVPQDTHGIADRERAFARETVTQRTAVDERQDLLA